MKRKAEDKEIKWMYSSAMETLLSSPTTIRLPDPDHYAPLTRGDSRALRNLKGLTKEKRPTDTNIWGPQEND